MFEILVNLVFELFAVYRVSASPSARGIASLDHEVGDNAVEDDIVVISALGQSREILTGLRAVSARLSSVEKELCEPLVHGCCRVLL